MASPRYPVSGSCRAASTAAGGPGSGIAARMRSGLGVLGDEQSRYEVRGPSGIPSRGGAAGGGELLSSASFRAMSNRARALVETCAFLRQNEDGPWGRRVGAGLDPGSIFPWFHRCLIAPRRVRSGHSFKGGGNVLGRKIDEGQRSRKARARARGLSPMVDAVDALQIDVVHGVERAGQLFGPARRGRST